LARGIRLLSLSAEDAVEDLTTLEKSDVLRVGLENQKKFEDILGRLKQ